jgi:hypothetical protein
MRHRSHVSAALVKLQAEREAQHGISLLDRLEALIVRTERLLNAAEQSGAIGAALQAIAQMWKGLELYGKVTGELRTGTTNQVVNIMASPEILQVVKAVRAVLADDPARLEQFSDLMRLPEHAE